MYLDVYFAPTYAPGGIRGSKWRSGGHWDQLLSIFDRFWKSPGHLLGVICAPVGALHVIFGPLDRLLRGLGPTFESNIVEKSVFAILVPRVCETTTFMGLAAQVGATWSIKSRPRGARGSKSGGQDSKKGAKTGQSGRPVCGSYGNGPQTVRKSSQVGGQSLSKRQVI